MPNGSPQVDTASFVDGVDLHHDSTFTVVDPGTGAALAEVGAATAADVDRAVAAARRAFDDGPWPRLAPRDRARVLRRLGDLLLRDREEFAHLESCDTGKPLTQARTDVDVSARYMEFYAGVIESVHGDTIPAIPGVLAYTLREPLGVTAHIEPWNYPLQLGCRTTAPALAMGNCAVLKPAEEAPLSLLRLARLAARGMDLCGHRRLPAGSTRSQPVPPLNPTAWSHPEEPSDLPGTDLRARAPRRSRQRTKRSHTTGPFTQGIPHGGDLSTSVC